MTAARDPFPTVKKLAAESGADWPHFEEAARKTIEVEAVFKEAVTTKFGTGRVLDTDSSLVLFGSFGRYEMGEGSDCDWTLLINGVVSNRHPDDARLIQSAISEAAKNGKGLKAPGPGGTFGNLCFSHDLVHKIGGGADSNENLTRRILMLLESRALSLSPADSAVQVRRAVMQSIIERYLDEDVRSSRAKKVPRFFLNDLTRYWRTICVDYAAKHREQQGAKWAIRNAKLRLSRKLLYAAGLAFCFRCHLDSSLWEGGEKPETEPFLAAAMNFAETPPLEYLAVFIDRCLKGDLRQETINAIFGAYDQWLFLLNDGAKRTRLEELDHAEADSDPTFGEVRTLGSEFAKGLKLLFFGRHDDEQDIANLGLDYIGF